MRIENEYLINILSILECIYILHVNIISIITNKISSKYNYISIDIIIELSLL